MTIALTTSPGGLFRRLGKIGLLAKDLNIFQAGTLLTDLNAIINQYANIAGPVVSEPDLIASMQAARDGLRTATGASTGLGQALAQATVNRMVYEDNPLLSRTSLNLSLKELIRQMTGVASVQVCAVTGSVGAITGTGNGVVIVSTKRGDGLVNENIFAEVGKITCTADAQTGGATSGNETFQFTGAVAQPNVWAYDWPLGSGAAVVIKATDGSKNNSAGNMLNNGDFETFAAAVPGSWTTVTGAAQISKDTVNFYSGAGALKITGDSATNVSLRQQFNLSTGTLAKLKPDTVYAVNFWCRVDVNPAAGVLTVDLVDGTPTVINDDQAVANSFTVNVVGLGTTFVAKNGFFRTPKVLSAVQSLRFRMSTALSTGSALSIDRVAFTPATKCYPGGIYAAVFSGSTPYILKDYYSITTTNDRGGASNNATFQTLADRLFGMRAQELLLPSSGSPTIADSLIG